MKKKTTALLSICAGAAIIAVALAAFHISIFGEEQPRPVGALVPEGAALYIECSNMRDLLSLYDRTPLVRAYLASSNYAEFKKSKLYLRLKDKLGALESASGVKFTVAALKQISGGEFGAAVYDVSSLDFIIVSRVNRAQILASELFRRSAPFEQRERNGLPCYCREDAAGNIRFIFTICSNYFIAADSLRLFDSSCALLTGAASNSLASSAAYRQARPDDFRCGDLTVFCAGELITDMPQFRSYWIYRNADDFRTLQSCLFAVDFEKDSVSEDRYYLYSGANAVSAPASILCGIPESAQGGELISMRSKTDAAEVIEEKFLRTFLSRYSGGAASAAQRQAEAAFGTKLAQAFTVAQPVMAAYSYRARAEENTPFYALDSALVIPKENINVNAFAAAMAGFYSDAINPAGVSALVPTTQAAASNIAVAGFSAPFAEPDLLYWYDAGKYVVIGRSADYVGETAQSISRNVFTVPVPESSSVCAYSFLNLNEARKTYAALLTQQEIADPGLGGDLFSGSVKSLFDITDAAQTLWSYGDVRGAFAHERTIIDLTAR